MEESVAVDRQSLPVQVDEAALLLRDVSTRNVDDRAEVFDDVHRLLQDALAEVEGG